MRASTGNAVTDIDTAMKSANTSGGTPGGPNRGLKNDASPSPRRNGRRMLVAEIALAERVLLFKSAGSSSSPSARDTTSTTTSARRTREVTGDYFYRMKRATSAALLIAVTIFELIPRLAGSARLRRAIRRRRRAWRWHATRPPRALIRWFVARRTHATIINRHALRYRATTARMNAKIAAPARGLAARGRSDHASVRQHVVHCIGSRITARIGRRYRSAARNEAAANRECGSDAVTTHTSNLTHNQLEITPRARARGARWARA